MAGDFPLLHDGEEISAPILLGLSHLGFSYLSQGKKLTLRTPAGREILLTMGERKATVEGQEVELKAAPGYLNNRCYLPVRSLADALGMSVSWQEDEKRLTLRPRLTTLKVEEDETAVTLNIGAQIPLAHREGKLLEPPRIFVDIENVALDAAQVLEVNSGLLLQVRTAERGDGKPGFRVVAFLSQLVDCPVEVSQGGCLLQLKLPKRPTLSAAPKAVLREVGVSCDSGRLVTISLSLSAPAVVYSEMDRERRLLVLRIFDTGSSIERLPPVPENPVISSLELHAQGTSGEVQELVIGLKQETRHVIQGEGNQVRVLIGEFSLAGVKVVIDPGHGGCMTGAVGRTGLVEKEINLDIALRLEELLEAAGARVYLTRREDCELRPILDSRGVIDRASHRAELYMRPGLANAVGADLFISLHCNANANSNPRPRTGSEVYYGKPRSRLLAQTIQAELVKQLQRRDGGVICREGLVVTREARMPAVLVEVAYLDNKQEEKLLATQVFRTSAAKAIFTGLTRYLDIGGPLGAATPPAAIPLPAAPGAPARPAPQASPAGAAQ